MKTSRKLLILTLAICVVVVHKKVHLHKQLARGQNARSCSTVTITLARVWAASTVLSRAEKLFAARGIDCCLASCDRTLKVALPSGVHTPESAPQLWHLSCSPSALLFVVCPRSVLLYAQRQICPLIVAYYEFRTGYEKRWELALIDSE